VRAAPFYARLCESEAPLGRPPTAGALHELLVDLHARADIPDGPIGAYHADERGSGLAATAGAQDRPRVSIAHRELAAAHKAIEFGEAVAGHGGGPNPLGLAAVGKR
jgi:hypothetical protein